MIPINVGGISIEFEVGDLKSILGTENEGLELYTFRKEIVFHHLLHVNGVRNICK